MKKIKIKIKIVIFCGKTILLAVRRQFVKTSSADTAASCARPLKNTFHYKIFSTMKENSTREERKRVKQPHFRA